MSRLEKLMHLYCLDGVKYVSLKEIAEYSKERIDAIDVDENTYVGVDNLLQDKLGKRESNCVPTEGRLTKYFKNDILIGNIRPYLKKIWLANNDGGTNGDVLVIHIKDKMVLPKFLYYCLSSDAFFQYDMKYAKGAKMPRGNKNAIMDYRLPVPAYEVQVAIINILDEFNVCTKKLSVTLSDEMNLRIKQKEFYGYGIFDFKDTVYKPISEIADTNIGLATSVTKHKRNSGVRLLHNSDIQPNAIVLKKIEYISEEFAEKNSSKLLHKNDIITVHTGDVGTSAVIDDEYDGAIGFTTITSRVKDDKTILPQYLCHYLNSDRCKADIAKMTISDRSNLNQKDFEKLIIPIPSIEEQKKVISLLDRFNAIYDELIDGITDEITLAKKRYEYYRERLLTFKEIC